MNLTALTLVVLAAVPPALVAAPPPEATLDSLLHVLNRYADLYRDSALRFSCDESITYSPKGAFGRKYELEYLYVYTPELGLRDYRTQRGADHSKDRPDKEVDLGSYGLPSVVERAYSWVFTFERGKWGLHNYRVKGQETVLGREALVVSFEPRPPYKLGINDWVGEAWIDKETHQLLRVESFKLDQHALKAQLDADLAGRGPFPEGKLPTYYVSKVITEFGVEKNGLRFPSWVEIRRTRFDVHNESGQRSATEHAIYRVRQEYSNYRFFSVRTLDEVRNYVLVK